MSKSYLNDTRIRSQVIKVICKIIKLIQIANALKFQKKSQDKSKVHSSFEIFTLNRKICPQIRTIKEVEYL